MSLFGFRIRIASVFGGLVVLTITSLNVLANDLPEGLKQMMLERQIFFRNDMSFNDGQSSSGASAFLFESGGQTYAGTAKHLLGWGLGFEPEIKPTELDAKLIAWSLISPVNGASVASLKEIVNANDDEYDDIVVLKAQVSNDTRVLSVAKAPIETGEIYYLIGCPYAESDCRQNAYPMKANKINSNNVVFELDPPSLNTRGFSGAPILNEKGEVVAAYAGKFKDGTRGATAVLTVFEN